MKTRSTRRVALAAATLVALLAVGQPAHAGLGKYLGNLSRAAMGRSGGPTLDGFAASPPLGAVEAGCAEVVFVTTVGGDPSRPSLMARFCGESGVVGNKIQQGSRMKLRKYELIAGDGLPVALVAQKAAGGWKASWSKGDSDLLLAKGYLVLGAALSRDPETYRRVFDQLPGQEALLQRQLGMINAAAEPSSGAIGSAFGAIVSQSATGPGDRESSVPGPVVAPPAPAPQADPACTLTLRALDLQLTRLQQLVKGGAPLPVIAGDLDLCRQTAAAFLGAPPK
jgi:hypothetical protein